MKRLQRKCVIVSAAAHGLLLLVLVIGSAFQASRPQNERPSVPGTSEPPIIKLVSLPQGTELPQVQPSQASTAITQPISTPRQSDLSRPQQFVSNPVAPTGDRIRKGPQISTNLVSRTPGPRSHDRLGTASNDRAQRIQQTIDNLSQGFSGGSAIDIPIGSNDGMGNSAYAQIVKDVYSQSWNPEDTSISDEATTKAQVIIAKDGRVLSARIIGRSSDPRLDQSIQQLLQTVERIRPFEDGARDQQRTYTINFNLRSHGLSGN